MQASFQEILCDIAATIRRSHIPDNFKMFMIACLHLLLAYLSCSVVIRVPLNSY